MRPDEFWGSNHYGNPPLTDRMIAEAERRLGVRLPRRYVALLRVQNGGYTREPFACPLVEGADRLEDCVTLDELNGIVVGATSEAGGVHDILKSAYMIREWGLPERQVLLAGDGHTWLSLDYRDCEPDDDAPFVVWFDTEMEREKFVAESFDAFFNALRPASEFED